MSAAAWFFFGMWCAVAILAAICMYGWYRASEMTDEALAGWNEALDKLEHADSAGSTEK